MLFEYVWVAIPIYNDLLMSLADMFHLAWDKAIFVYKLAVTGWEVHSLAVVFCDFHPQN